MVTSISVAGAWTSNSPLRALMLTGTLMFLQFLAATTAASVARIAAAGLNMMEGGECRFHRAALDIWKMQRCEKATKEIKI